jgi:AcrR family transcriptional regulator
MAQNAAMIARPADADRRALLLGAAYELLAEDGLDGLTIRAVLARTGLARRAFYDCFPGKDELVLAVFESTLQLAAQHYGSMALGMADPIVRLRFIIMSIVQGQGDIGEVPDQPRDRRGAALSREHMRLAESHPEQLHAALRPLLAMISAQLADGMEQGSVRRADPDRLASFVYNLVSSTAHTEFIAAADGSLDPVRRKALAEDIWEFCRRAIAA